MKRFRGAIQAAAFVVAVVVILPGCLIGYDADGVEVLVPENTDPRVLVIAPVPMAVVTDQLEVELELRNLTLIAPDSSRENSVNEAHLIVSIDDNCVMDGGGCRPFTESRFGIDLSAFESGNLQLSLELFNNDGSVYESISIIVIDFEKS